MMKVIGIIIVLAIMFVCFLIFAKSDSPMGCDGCSGNCEACIRKVEEEKNKNEGT